MKLALLCLCLATTASAAPSPFHYLSHYTAPRQQVFPPAPSLPQIGIPGAYSVELIYPHRLPVGTGGSNGGLPFPSQGLLKISIPQPPGRQSVELYYPYDFSQQRIMTNMPPMSNSPQMPQGLPFEYPFSNTPQQAQNNPPFDTNPHPSQGPNQAVHQDQPMQANQIPVKP
ncbi:secretory calcium-binding phosphoprotein 5 [Channa argus]|uniref:secretory calcium-binding phosphoprotein 5 n=1 Tax=Channa argus TaxID=215402 RepID=UPI00351FC33B